MVERHNIIQRRAIAVIAGRRIFEQFFIPRDQCVVADPTQFFFCLGIVRNNKLFFF